MCENGVKNFLSSLYEYTNSQIKFFLQIKRMKPLKIILIRHAESEGNIDRTIYSTKPDYKLSLSEKGKSQAQEARKKLKEILNNSSVQVYCSPFYRTRETWNILKEELNSNSIKYKEDPRIREQEWGHIRSFELNEEIVKERDEYGLFYFRIPDGKSGAEVCDRVSDFVGSMFRDFEKNDFAENIIIVTHGMTLRIFLMKWFHLTVEEFEQLKIPIILKSLF